MEDVLSSEEDIPKNITEWSADSDDEKSPQMSQKEILNIINDIFLTNYWCTRKNMVNITPDFIVGLDKINELIDFFDKINFDNFDCINHIDSYYTKQSKIKLDNEEIALFLKNNSRPIYDILNIGNGKISLCGGAILSILKQQIPDDYDLFFHSDSVDEIDDIFNTCLNYLESLNQNDLDNIVNYSRSQYIMNVKINNDNFYGDIQFIKRVYKTKEHILLGFDLAPSRFGYNPKDGIFTTICGAMAYSMSAFALDSSVRSTSFGHRLDKYCHNKYYRILVPQIDVIKNMKNIDDDNIFHIFDNISLIKNNIYNENPESFRLRVVDKKNDDYANNDNNINLLIEEDYNNITFSSESLQIISELPDDFIETVMRNKTKLFDKPSSMELSKKEIKRFLDNRYKEFALSYFIDEDEEKADSIWEEKTQHYIELAKKCAKNINNNPDKNYYKGWKYLNSGSKYFGQNYPVNNPPSEYYKPLVIGITMDKFQAFMDCRKNIEYISNLPKEIFEFICEYWLKYEANDARDRLLMLQSIKEKKKFNLDEEDELELILPGW
jgi:hypothetical protein